MSLAGVCILGAVALYLIAGFILRDNAPAVIDHLAFVLLAVGIGLALHAFY